MFVSMGLQILIKDTIPALAEQYKKIKKDVVFSEKILALS